jgi:hypothetical protein
VLNVFFSLDAVELGKVWNISTYSLTYFHLRVSVTVNVRQALKAEDTRQLAIAMFKIDDKTIAATAKELTGQEAVQLIDYLAKVLVLEPNSFARAMEWIKELLMSHAPFISSQTSTKLRLKPILDILNQRVADQPDIVRTRQITDALLKSAKEASVAVSTPTNSTEGQEPQIRWRPEQ